MGIRKGEGEWGDSELMKGEREERRKRRENEGRGGECREGEKRANAALDQCR